jgi:hypothetical protein
MFKTKFLIAVAACLAALQCGSSTQSTVLKDKDGKPYGRYDTISDTEAKANFDANQNGINERVSTYKENQLTAVEYFDDKSGAKTKAVSMKEGKPESVKVYDKEGKDVRGDVLFDQGKAKEVILPAKNKKVIFNPDGTTTVTGTEAK